MQCHWERVMRCLLEGLIRKCLTLQKRQRSGQGEVSTPACHHAIACGIERGAPHS